MCIISEPREIIFLGTDLGWVTNNGLKIDNNHFDKNYKAYIPDPIKVKFPNAKYSQTFSRKDFQ